MTLIRQAGLYADRLSVNIELPSEKSLKQLGVVVSRAHAYIRCDGLPTRHWQGASLTHRPPSPQIPQCQGRLNAVPTRESNLIFVTDGTFEGLLTAIFDAYTAERPPEAVESSSSDQLGFFERRITIPNDPTKSERVWKGLKKHLGSKRRRQLFDAYLSGGPGVETMIYRFVRDAIPGRNALRSEASPTPATAPLLAIPAGKAELTLPSGRLFYGLNWSRLKMGLQNFGQIPDTLVYRVIDISGQ